MIFNVSQLIKEPSGSRRTFQVNQAQILVDEAHTSRVLGTVRLLRTDQGIWVSARLDSEVQCTCSRCLKEHVQPIRMTIEEEFLPRVSSTTGAVLPDDRAENFYIDELQVLDISEAVQQYSELSIPMKPVCHEGCAGICLACGLNLNDGTCECDKEPRDQRWGELLELVQADDRNN